MVTCSPTAEIEPMRVAYLSGGRLFVQDGPNAAREIESAFGQELVRSALQVAQKREWKTKGTGALFMSGGMLWGVDEREQQLRNVRITGMTRVKDANRLFLALQSSPVGALLIHDLGSAVEKRVLHREHFNCTDLAHHPEEAWLACSLRFENGTANIGFLTEDASEQSEVTEGDSVDEAPSWVPGTSRVIYQSAGVARSSEGFPMGTGPFAVMSLDLDSGELEVLLQDDRYDFLTARKTASGDLLYIRRPYEAFHRPSPLRMAGDIVLFPFRLLRALFAYLNFFSLTYSRKPLTTAGGPKLEGADLRQLIVRGRMVDAARRLRETGNDDRALVPRSWELRRRSADGSEECLARSVLCFDLAPDDSIVYSNGTTIFRLNERGKPSRLLSASLVESVLVLQD